MSEELNYDDLTLVEIPVTIGGKKYVLREADEETAEMFQNAQIKGARVQDGEMISLPTDVAGVQSLLVSRCLYQCDDDGKLFRQSVSRDIVKKWPSRVVKPLFEKAKEISELNEGVDLESLEKQRRQIDKQIAKIKAQSAKNERSDTGDGSG